MRTKCKWMHIDRAHKVAVATKPADATLPVSSPGLVRVPADRTPARCSSFGAGEAHNAGVLGFMGEVVNVTAVFPLRHAAIVVATAIPVAHAVRVSDEERPDFLLDTEVDDCPGGFVPQIADASVGPSAHRVLRALELLPAPRVFLAPTLLFGELPKLLAALSLKTTDTAPGDDHGFAHIRCDSSEVDFPQVHGCLHRTGGCFRLRYLYADVQLEAPVPDERAGPGIVRQGKRQDERRVTFAHRQHDAPLLAMDSLSGPLDRVKPLDAPGILHVHLRMLIAQRTGGLNIRKEGVDNLLHGLSIEGEAAFGGSFQFLASRPRRMAHTGFLVQFHTTVPHAGCFLLRRFEAVEASWREIG